MLHYSRTNHPVPGMLFMYSLLFVSFYIIVEQTILFLVCYLCILYFLFTFSNYVVISRQKGANRARTHNPSIMKQSP